ncbi:hypothetical protein HAX54_019994 [Datura stramonium]|uniref:Uncharacterized protein n=1 Tax=Datura stramonium TaxID=4076 RepID=A0ABS8S5Q4_DATST|nr:hypothetical protein [Datura stramonium]
MFEECTNAPTQRVNPINDEEMEEFIWRKIAEADKKIVATKRKCEEVDQAEDTTQQQIAKLDKKIVLMDQNKNSTLPRLHNQQRKAPALAHDQRRDAPALGHDQRHEAPAIQHYRKCDVERPWHDGMCEAQLI